MLLTVFFPFLYFDEFSIRSIISGGKESSVTSRGYLTRTSFERITRTQILDYFDLLLFLREFVDAMIRNRSIKRILFIINVE